MNSSFPIGAAGLDGSLGQVVDSRIALRNLHFPRADVESEASDQGDFPGDGELCVALCQCLLGVLALGDVAGDSKQLHGSAVRLAHDCTFDRNPAFSTTALLISARCETVFGPTAAARTTQCRKSGVQLGKVVWMDLRPHLREGLWCRFRAMSVNMSIAHVIFEAARFQLKAPDTELGTIESQLQPMVAVFERGLISPPFGEQRGENERAHRYGQQPRVRGMHAVGKTYARITEAADAERDGPDDSKSEDERRRCSKHRPTTGGRPQQQREEQAEGQDREPVVRGRAQADCAH